MNLFSDRISLAVEKIGASQEDYHEVEKFLQAAKGRLTEDEFKEYIELTNQLMQLKLKISDENGIRNEEKLTKEEQQQWAKLTSKLEPYFEKINGIVKP
ncbi:DUF3600 domain-containing protein [Paenibacillus provencensis]|uniref:DUF3600 domain-containing protein n=1 Tax=Paenibacillus provencensis TaxID=441151 RepID=A0ABW3PUR0_9BACL|nr:DUF3600 domain-containing protein [Paenibacillus sp. MER 78]MCM3127960.1 DUF3600 domain-containing protein [Paenibacillus sp. MER 78]